MAIGLANPVVDHLRRVVLVRDGHGLSDGQLLECFLARRDGAAFASLVDRHGPMVMGVCRRVLGNHQDAEDAFQATFLVLARKAASVVPREMVGNWLYGVAYRSAAKLRTLNARRRARERQVAEMPEPVAARPDDLWQDVRPLLDRELSHLPDAYRTAIVLCDLEGKTGKEAARQLGWPEGTVASRLSRGRKLLARRLTRRGHAVSGTALAALLRVESTPVPTTVTSSTIRAALSAASSLAGGAASTKALALAEGVIHAMFLTKLKVLTGVLFAFGAAAITCGALASGPSDATPAPRSSEDGVQLARADDRPERAEQPDMPDGFIVRAGEYRLYGGKLLVKVWAERGGLRWNATFPGSAPDRKTTLGSGDPQLHEGSPWFLFPASADVLWAYEADAKRMILIKRHPSGDFVMKHGDLPSGWKDLVEIERAVPDKVLKRLPANLRPEGKRDR
jgi:RNA polymerase sigma factor (sigma-70 family)